MKKIPIEFRLAVVVAVVFGTIGSLLWINGGWNMGDGYYFGDKVFQFASPLTAYVFQRIVENHGQFSRPDDIWAIPMCDLLLVIQYLVWAGVIYAFRLLIGRLSSRRSNQAQGPTT
jgi:hypothetical protein